MSPNSNVVPYSSRIAAVIANYGTYPAFNV
jgi:hypothetical protein